MPNKEKGINETSEAMLTGKTEAQVGNGSRVGKPESELGDLLMTLL